MTRKLEDALAYLKFLIKEGWEFPDACSKAAFKHNVDYTLLRRAYDESYA